MSSIYTLIQSEKKLNGLTLNPDMQFHEKNRIGIYDCCLLLESLGNHKHDYAFDQNKSKICQIIPNQNRNALRKKNRRDNQKKKYFPFKSVLKPTPKRPSAIQTAALTAEPRSD